MPSEFTFVLVGPHGAGKTTVGALLARELGVPFHPEIGRILASNPDLRASCSTASSPQVAFDELVFTEELARDAAVGGGRVVETWHPGNLAFATRRSPRVAAAFLSGVREACTGKIVVIPVIAATSVLERRKTEPGESSFFLRVGIDAVRWARGLGLRVTAPVNTSGGDPRQAVSAALRQVRRLGIKTPVRWPPGLVEAC